MSKHTLYREEWWPVYELDEKLGSYDPIVEIPDTLVERYRVALEEWQSVQTELSLILTEWELANPRGLK